SSASGLFQFTKQTWLHMVKQYGAQYGLGNYASQITTDANGHMTVSDPAAKQAILALRNDPQCSAVMACELDKQNALSLKQNVGGKIGGTELYLAHFLGAGGASDFINTMRSDPTATGASVLPEAAAANPSVFYDKSGEPRTVQQIYQHFAQKFGNGTVQIAKATSPAPTAASYNVAANTPIQINMPNLYGSSVSSANLAAATGTANLGNITLASSSTMFSAMLLGQMNSGAGNAATSALNAINQSDDKKKNAMSILSAVA
ncbi:MAG: hypothetical protein WCD70_00210, partial [Alphaproteobacteria bacterium]